MKSALAKIYGWGQFLLISAEQVSLGHFPQNKAEWIHLITALAVALAVHHGSSTDGTK